MQNPQSTLALEGQHPDTYGDTNHFWQNVNGCIPNQNTNDMCYVHNNSTVLSHWFYLLCQGGSGTNGIYHAYYVTGIGIAKAERIAYRAETNYLNSSADFNAARNATVSAAIDLYGTGSAEVCATS